jgi:dolichol-phosphate mannosyltransferase
MARSVESVPSSQPSAAVAIPAYDEADGIGGFVREIDRALAPRVSSLALIVIDDASSDETGRVLSELEPQLQGKPEVIRNAENRGHGPSVLKAYRRALDHRPDYVLQVDGDGQFLGSDLRRLLVLLIDEAHAVSGVRRFRQDPWFRMIMTRLVRSYVNFSFGVSARDPNCPLRGYEAAMLHDLLSAIPGAGARIVTGRPRALSRCRSYSRGRWTRRQPRAGLASFGCVCAALRASYARRAVCGSG